jgi:hypothetical protein
MSYLHSLYEFIDSKTEFKTFWDWYDCAITVRLWMNKQAHSNYIYRGGFEIQILWFNAELLFKNNNQYE